jgi:hypothetical protein
MNSSQVPHMLALDLGCVSLDHSMALGINNVPDGPCLRRCPPRPASPHDAAPRWTLSASGPWTARTCTSVILGNQKLTSRATPCGSSQSNITYIRAPANEVMQSNGWVQQDSAIQLRAAPDGAVVFDTKGEAQLGGVAVKQPCRRCRRRPRGVGPARHVHA